MPPVQVAVCTMNQMWRKGEDVTEKAGESEKAGDPHESPFANLSRTLVKLL